MSVYEDEDGYWVGRLAVALFTAKARAHDPQEVRWVLDATLRDFKASRLYEQNREMQKILESAR